MNQTSKPLKQYNLLTTVVGFDIISQLSVEGPDVQQVVLRQVLKTQDEHVKKALIELGWTPPPAETRGNQPAPDILIKEK